eukprot:SAG31_NODE_5727_length_2358_cov_1.263834_2_plen_407_part_00
MADPAKREKETRKAAEFKASLLARKRRGEKQAELEAAKAQLARLKAMKTSGAGATSVEKRAELDAAVHRFCFASFIAVKLIHECLFDVMAAWLLSIQHPGSTALIELGIQCEALKLIHLPLTMVLPRFASSAFLTAAFAGAACTYAAVLVTVASRALFSDPATTSLIPAWLYAVVWMLEICTIATDAVTDAMCRARRMHLAPVAKLAGLLSTAIMLGQRVEIFGTQRWYDVALLAFLGISGTVSCLWASIAASRLKSGGTLIATKNSAVASLGFVSAVSFATVVLVGDSGEEILDTVTKYKINAELFGGNASPFVVKQLISLAVGAVTLAIFAANYYARFSKESAQASPGEAFADTAGLRREVWFGVIAVRCLHLHRLHSFQRVFLRSAAGCCLPWLCWRMSSTVC